jgi:LysM repeat protein
MDTPHRKGLAFLLLLSLIFGWGLPGCGGPVGTDETNPTETPNLIKYSTAPPSETAEANVEIIETATPKPAPTATPFTHTVVTGDTLLGIALRYGLSLEELMAANPEVNPRILSVGAELEIPLGETQPVELPQPTPLPLMSEHAVCYPIAEGGKWCYWLVENELKVPVENLSARMSLYSSSGQLIAETIAIPALNILEQDQAIPIAAFFPPPLPDEIVPNAELLTATAIETDNERYLESELNVTSLQISQEGNQADLEGEVVVQGEREARLIWIFAIAYDSEGRVAGTRKVEFYARDDADLPTQAILLREPIRSGESLPFELSVYSLGPAIATVEVLVEVRP